MSRGAWNGGLAALAAVLVLSAAFFLGGAAPANPQEPNQSGPNQTSSASVLEQEKDIASLSAFVTPEDTAGTATAAFEQEPSAAREQGPAAQTPAVQPDAQEQPSLVPPDSEPEAKAWQCTLSISCATILDNLDALPEEKKDLVPSDGLLLAPVTVDLTEGESVFDLLRRLTRDQGIHMEFSNTPVYNSAYIEGIGNLYEFDCGSLSGWVYRVNGTFPNYGCSSFQLRDGDVVEWLYSCDLGKDVGGSNFWP